MPHCVLQRVWGNIWDILVKFRPSWEWFWLILWVGMVLGCKLGCEGINCGGGGGLLAEVVEGSGWDDRVRWYARWRVQVVFTGVGWGEVEEGGKTGCLFYFINKGNGPGYLFLGLMVGWVWFVFGLDNKGPFDFVLVKPKDLSCKSAKLEDQSCQLSKLH